jgi:hypothetical protein
VARKPLIRTELEPFACPHHGEYNGYLYSACHSGYPFHAALKDTVLRLRCGRCKRLVLEIAISPQSEIQAPSCHSDPFLYHMRYKDGVLRTECGECGAAIGTLIVRSALVMA